MTRKEPKSMRGWEKWGESVPIYYQKVEQHWKKWEPSKYGAPSYEAWVDATGFEVDKLHGGYKFQRLLHFLLLSHEKGGSVEALMDEKLKYKDDYVAAVIDLIDTGGRKSWPAEILSKPTSALNKKFKADTEAEIKTVGVTHLPGATSHNSAVVPFDGKDRWKKSGPILVNNSMGNQPWRCAANVPFRTIPEWGTPWNQYEANSAYVAPRRAI